MRARLVTNYGVLILELDPEKAPATVANFVRYVKSGFYDNTLFHRVIPNFMIQGGGLERGMYLKPTEEPIRNEAANGLKNKKFTVAAARLPDPHSASSQFFINVADNDFFGLHRAERGGLRLLRFRARGRGRECGRRHQRSQNRRALRLQGCPRAGCGD